MNEKPNGLTRRPTDRLVLWLGLVSLLALFGWATLPSISSIEKRSPSPQRRMGKALVLSLLNYQDAMGALPYSDEGELDALTKCVDMFGEGRIHNGSEEERSFPEADLRNWSYINEKDVRDTSSSWVLVVSKTWRTDRRYIFVGFADGSVRTFECDNRPDGRWVGCWWGGDHLFFRDRGTWLQWLAIRDLPGLKSDDPERMKFADHPRLGLKYVYEYHGNDLNACIILGKDFRVVLRFPKDELQRVIGIETSIEGDASAIPEELKAVLPER